MIRKTNDIVHEATIDVRNLDVLEVYHVHTKILLQLDVTLDLRIENGQIQVKDIEVQREDIKIKLEDHGQDLIYKNIVLRLGEDQVLHQNLQALHQILV